MQTRLRPAGQSPDEPERNREAGDLKHHPEEQSVPGAEKAERDNDSQSNRWAGRDLDLQIAEADGFFEMQNFIDVVGVGAMNDLLPRGPVADEIARGGVFLLQAEREDGGKNNGACNDDAGSENASRRTVHAKGTREFGSALGSSSDSFGGVG